MINNIKIGAKLIGSLIGVLVILAAISVIGYTNIKSIAARSDVMYRQNTLAIEEMGSINAILEKMRGDIYRYFDVSADRQKMAQSINDAITSVNEIMQTYKSRNIGAEEKRIIADFDAAWPEMQRGYKEGMMRKDEGKDDEVARLLGAGSYAVQARVKTFAAVKALNEINRKNAEAANKANTATASTASVTVLIVSIFAVAVALVLGLMLAMSITLPLYKVMVMIQEMGKGHLSYRLNLKRKDEIGVLTNEMDQFADNLQKYVVKGMQQISKGNIDIETPVMDDKDEIGPALKNMVETINNLVREMNVLSKSAMEGKLDVRGNAETFDGAYREIVAGVNKTLDAVMGPINEASGVLVQVANRFLNSASIVFFEDPFLSR